MKVLVTGIEGQVARSIAEVASRHLGFEVALVGRPDLDLAHKDSILPAIARHHPDIVVNAAAYTAVDKAEDEQSVAHAVNAVGAGLVAEAAAGLGVPVIHLSTDYVFSGEADRPYLEDDAPAPQNVYGRTKLAGEVAVAAASPRHVILRTSWVYSPFGRNFVRTMLGLARDRESVSVVSDQWGNPTSALDIAEAVLHVAATVGSAAAPPKHFGTFHFAGSGSTNWSGFAAEIFQISGNLGGPSAKVVEIDSASFPVKATRPKSSCLDTARFVKVFGWQPPPWQGSLELVAQRLLCGTEE